MKILFLYHRRGTFVDLTGSPPGKTLFTNALPGCTCKRWGMWPTGGQDAIREAGEEVGNQGSHPRVRLGCDGGGDLRVDLRDRASGEGGTRCDGGHDMIVA